MFPLKLRLIRFTLDLFQKISDGIPRYPCFLPFFSRLQLSLRLFSDEREAIPQHRHAEDLTWIPTQNMTASEVRELLLRAKVYVDFGDHPGKERIPREAAISGCCVITGRKGSANYYTDVPIPDTYKFHDPVTEAVKILDLIRDIFPKL